MVYIAHTGGGNEAPLTAKNLAADEIEKVVAERFRQIMSRENY